MSKPTIIITGANGFIGEYLVHFFFEKNWNVKALVHHFPKKQIQKVSYYEYNLETKPEMLLFENVDYLVHCAYLKFENNNNSSLYNINATKDLISICREKSIKFVFLSSFSAHAKAESVYGKTKLECEKLVDTTKDIVLKPGFVVGKKGLCGEIINQINKSKLFPLVGGGKQPIQTISVRDLCIIIEKVLVENYTGTYFVAENKAHTMKEFYLEIAKQLKRKIVFVPIPYSILYAVCKCVELVGIKLPVTSESVLGLKQLRVFDTEADLKKLKIGLKNCKESLQEILK
jgi:nucleoside-diphosphate-sugar epimerase